MSIRSAMKRLLFLAIALLVLIPLLVIGFQMFSEPGSREASVAAANPAEQVKRGEYLARAGNCMGCHTVRGGAVYAGGRAIATPFGNIYTSNITPDDKTGIGSWSADDFWRAIHNGKSKDGSFLYPAFPYPNYTKVSRADADAIYAFLRTIPPVRQENREHELRSPYNHRVLLAFWRTLYFKPGVYQADAQQSAQWNRGAYLVEGLGHCAACHTTRNALGGTIDQDDLAGGMIPMLNWYAASLTSDRESGLGDVAVQDVADLLKTGVSQRSAVYGPMAEVVSGSLQHLSPSDIEGMALYLKSVPKTDAVASASVEAGDPIAILSRGAKLYDEHCAACHQSNGRGVPSAYPALAGNHPLTAASSINPIRMVLIGGYPPSTVGNPRPFGMPPFSAALTDDEVAAVVSYVRMAWGNKGTLVSPFEVGRVRGAPIE